MLSGTFNAGFVGVSSRPEASAILQWWQDRLLGACSYAVADGVYYDQRWLDLAPVLFEGVGILRDAGCNVAYWNLQERQVAVGAAGITVGGGPARFFHFSGFDPHDGRLSKFDEARIEEAGAAAEVYRRYAALLIRAGYRRRPGERG
jgi:hypothetical protein